MSHFVGCHKSLKENLTEYLVVRGMTPGDAVAAVYRYEQSWRSIPEFRIDASTSAQGVDVHINDLLDMLREEGIKFGEAYEYGAEGKPNGIFE